MLIRVSAIALMLTSLTEALPQFVRLIPNGSRVKHPCIFFFPWYGVGHVNPFGDFDLNSFGQDFQAADLKWTTDLCNADSDGDGKTNGEELGDPDCRWSLGDEPSRTRWITHPGYKPFDPAGCFCPFNTFCIFNRRRILS